MIERRPYELEIARRDLVPDVAARLCPEDVVELRHVGQTPAQAILGSIDASERSGGMAFFLHIAGAVAAVFGVVKKTEESGVFWLLTTTTVRRHPRAFITAAKQLVPFLVAECGTLYNDLGIDKEHKAALRLAEHMGFSLGVERVLPNGATFIPFRLEARRVHGG